MREETVEVRLRGVHARQARVRIMSVVFRSAEGGLLFRGFHAVRVWVMRGSGCGGEGAAALVSRGVGGGVLGAVWICLWLMVRGA